MTVTSSFIYQQGRAVWCHSERYSRRLSQISILVSQFSILKVLSSHLNWRARLDSFDPLLKLEVRQFFKKFFNETISRERHKTIKCGSRISEMTLSNQSHVVRYILISGHLIKVTFILVERSDTASFHSLFVVIYFMSSLYL
jgi:hypothetical protein